MKNPLSHSFNSTPNPAANPSFNSSTLVRLLAELTNSNVADSKQSLAERLGLWLGWADAISVSAVLNGTSARPLEPPAGAPWAAPEAAGELARARNELAHAITTDRVLKAGKLAVKSAVPASSTAGLPLADAALEGTADFAPYRRCHAAHQRAMETRIGLLRTQVRATLARNGAALTRLAALDAVLDDALAAREHSLLASVPSLLEKRFKRLGQAQPPAAWLAVFCQDMQDVLLAELELRMQPVEGLIEALDTEMTTQR